MTRNNMSKTKKITKEEERLRSALALIMPEDEFLALIERADSHADSLQLLLDEYQKRASEETTLAPQEPVTDDEAAIERSGLFVQSVERTYFDPMDRQTKSMAVGFIIGRKIGSAVTYAGKSMAWHHSPHSSVPFASRDEAMGAAKTYVSILDQYVNEKTYNVTQVLVEVPVSTDDQSIRYPTRVTVELDLEETKMMTRLRLALRSLNAEPRNDGKPVDSNAAAVRWLLRKIMQSID